MALCCPVGCVDALGAAVICSGVFALYETRPDADAAGRKAGIPKGKGKQSFVDVEGIRLQLENRRVHHPAIRIDDSRRFHTDEYPIIGLMVVKRTVPLCTLPYYNCHIIDIDYNDVYAPRNTKKHLQSILFDYIGGSRN